MRRHCAEPVLKKYCILRRDNIYCDVAGLILPDESSFSSARKECKGDNIVGLLDKFISKETQEQLKNLVKDVAEYAENAVKSDVPNKTYASYSSPQPAQPEPQYPEPVVVKLKVKHSEPFIIDAGAVGSDFDRGSAEYFIDVIEKNIPGVQTAANVPLSSLTADVPAKSLPVSVLVSRGGQPVIALMVVRKNDYRKVGVVNTMNACEDAGIPTIRFMSEFGNEPGYVAARIRAVMKKY